MEVGCETHPTSITNFQTMISIPLETQQRLREARNIWLATVRPGGTPHLVPIWFVTFNERIFICTAPDSVKIRNLRRNDRVALALEDGSHPLIMEGLARLLEREEAPAPVVEQFKTKYDWDITDGEQYTVVIEVTPRKWLGW